MKRKPRPKEDRVEPETAIYVFLRDGGCVVGALAILGKISVEDPCAGRLTLAHVRDRNGGRTGKRPPSTRRRLASVCAGHALPPKNIVDRKDVRPAVDAYLENLEGAEIDDSRPWETIRRVRSAALPSQPSERSGGL